MVAVRDRLIEYRCVTYLSTWPAQPFKDKLINGNDSACHINLRVLEYSFCLYSEKDNLDFHESVHRDTTIQITNKMHYID
jgi:hypothetical protein